MINVNILEMLSNFFPLKYKVILNSNWTNVIINLLFDVLNSWPTCKNLNVEKSVSIIIYGT